MKILKLVTDYMSVGVFALGVLGFIFPEFFSFFKDATPYLLGFVMFGMGLGLSFGDFFNVLTNPKTVIFGIGMQFIMMPLIAVMLTTFTAMPPEFAVGVLLVGCCPGGTASNVLTYLAKGNVALSVSITICTTLLAPLLTPAIFYLLAHNTIEVDYFSMMMTIVKIVIAPVFIGVLINAFLNAVAKKICIFMPCISSVTIMIIVAIVCSLSASKLDFSCIAILPFIIAHNVLGIVLTYVISRALHFNKKDCRTLAIEIGTQNSGLGTVLAIKYFTAISALVGSIFSIVQNVTGSLFAAYWNKQTHSNEDSKDKKLEVVRN